MSFSPKNANIPINRKYYDPLNDQERVNKFYNDIILVVVLELNQH